LPPTSPCWTNGSRNIGRLFWLKAGRVG
jgi:hypothetical protein